MGSDKCNSNKKQKTFIKFDDMVADVLSNRKLHPIVAALVSRGNKLNILLVFMTKSYVAIPKNIRLTFTHNFQ